MKASHLRGKNVISHFYIWNHTDAYISVSGSHNKVDGCYYVSDFALQPRHLAALLSEEAWQRDYQQWIWLGSAIERGALIA
jgi:hypothetical protein